jgi:hypothetical protein
MKKLLLHLTVCLVGCGGAKENLPVTIDLSTPPVIPSSQPSMEPIAESPSPEAAAEKKPCGFRLVCKTDDPDPSISYVILTSEDGSDDGISLIIDLDDPKYAELARIIKTEGVGFDGPKDPYRFVCLQAPLGLLLPPSP